MTRPNSLAVDAWNAAEAPRPIASWYTEGISDGVGDRLLMFDNSGTTSLELLRFRPELAAVRGFEEALRDRVDQLRAFHHPAFPQVRAVEHLDGGGLALVSTVAPGKRLAEILRNLRARSGVHPAFAAWLVRDLTAALADLERHGDGIAHAALTPDRIMVTPDGHLMVVEHVLGAALTCTRLTPSRLWLDYGLLAPGNADGTARLDCRTDMIQLGWIVLSALVGRRITSAEYPHRVGALLDEFVRAAGSRSTALVAALRSWLERALQVKDEAFASAMDAYSALCELRVHSGPQAIAFTARRHAAEPLAYEAPRQLPPVEVDPAPAHAEPTPVAAPDALAPSLESEKSTMTAATDVIAELRTRSRVVEVPTAAGVGVPARRGRNAGWIAAAAFALIAVAEGAALARLYFVRAAVPPPVAAPIVFDSLQPGDTVMVNGRQIGVTPLTLTLTPEVRSVRVQARAVLESVDLNAVRTPPVADPAADAAAAATAAALANARERRGGLRLVTPVEVQVLEGERVLGSSADGPIVATVGRHELDFINNAIGYRSRQAVDIKAGQIIRMTVSPPGGRVSVNAVPWAQVAIDGNPVGDTPIANLPLAAGEHQITFRHPQLGEQTQRVIVKSDALTRVSATLTR
jgi:PEGA domain